MSEDLAAALRARFGTKGLRALPAAPAGLPLQVGPYFTAPESAEPLSLGEFAALLGWDAVAMSGQPRIGADGGAQLYLAPDHSVRAAVLGTGLPELMVNGSLDAFTAGLLLLDRQLPALGAARDPQSAIAAYQELRHGLQQLDPTAFEDRENWWPRVLDDLRRPLNVDSSAAFEYVDETREKKIVTAISGPGLPHPEEIVWHRLKAAGVEPEQVTRVYCELEPCVMPGHYCSIWLADTFPDAEFTHSFDYGETAESREEGIKALMIKLAGRQG